MSSYDLELADAQYIVEMYQERAFENNAAMGVMATFANNVTSLRQVLEIADEAFKISNTGSFNRKPISEDMPDISGDVSCSDDVLEFEKDMRSVEKNFEIPVNVEKKKPRKLTEEEKDRTLANCIDCGDWPEFDLEWPVFGLDGLQNLLDAINSFKRFTRPGSLKSICPLLISFTLFSLMSHPLTHILDFAITAAVGNPI